MPVAFNAARAHSGEATRADFGRVMVINIANLAAPWRTAALLAAMAAVALVALPPAANGAGVTYTSPGCTSFVVSGTPPNQTVTCAGGGGGGGGGGAPVCTPTANPTTPAVGKTTTITANCSNQPLANTYVWTGGGCGGLSGPTCTVAKSRATSVVFTVQATNASGLGAPGQITITWQ
jgi:hypothetical protein